MLFAKSKNGKIGKRKNFIPKVNFNSRFRTIRIKMLASLVLLQMLMISSWSSDKTPQRRSAFSFTEKQKKHRLFSKYFKVFDLQDQKQFPNKKSLLCIGSSSMRLWKCISANLTPLKVTHRGFGGSTMADVLDFKDFFLRYQADRIIIYEGDNDLWARCSPEMFINRCKEFVKYIHCHPIASTKH